MSDQFEEDEAMKERLLLRPGVIQIWTVLLLIIFIGFIGLAVDTSKLVLTAQELQNTADAAALAATQYVKSDHAMARTSAVEVAASNEASGVSHQLMRNNGNAANGDIVIGRYARDAREFRPTLDFPNAVRVVARRTTNSPTGTIPLIFGRVFGVNDAELTRYAIAMTSGGTGSGMLVLDHYAECALTVSGNGTLRVNNGEIHVNSEDPCAACTGGGPVIESVALNIYGGACLSSNTTALYETNTYVGYRIEDPLAGLPEPTRGPNRGTVSTTANVNLQPGFYPQGIRRTSGRAQLRPGIYYIGGDGLTVMGGDFHAENCMFYIKDGPVDLRGNGRVIITPPDPDVVNYPDAGTYEDVSVFQARDNVSRSRVNGSDLLDIDGTLYFPSNHVTLLGTGDGFGNQLIANTLEVSGNGVIMIDYDGRNPTPGNTPFLIE